MARITIEDCLENVPNRFSLVHLASQRARQLLKGSSPLVRSKNKFIVTSLREVAAQKVDFARELNEKEITEEQKG
jgi:DNA-directed RNA polymerase subunit omega